MGSSVFYLTKCLRCILFSFLLLLITLFLLSLLHLCDKNLGLVTVPFICVDSINITGSFFSKFINRSCKSFHSLLFFISMISSLLSGDKEKI